MLGRLVVGAAALAIGVALLLDNVDAIKLTSRGIFAVLLAIVGLGLLIGSWWGRARWLIIPGVILTIALAITSLVPLHIRGGVGEVTWSPEARANVRGSYELFAGRAILDLSKVDFESDRTVEVDVTFGELLIVVAEDQPVDARAKLLAGEMRLLGEEQEGLGIEERVQRSGDEDLGTLEIDSEVVFGKITVRDVRSTDNFETRRNDDRFNFGPDRNGDSFRFDPPVLERRGVR